MLVEKINSNIKNIGFSQDRLSASRIIKRVPVSELKYGPRNDYYRGDIFFTYNDDWLAETILYFTRRDKKSTKRAIHVGIIEDESTCLETTNKTITRTKLKDKYLNNSKFRLYIRRPKEMAEDLKDEFINKAKTAMGTRYARALLVVMALRNSPLGRLVDEVYNYRYFDLVANACKNVSSKLYKKGTLMCSEHLANTFKALDKWTPHNTGILTRPSPAINPQQIFEAEELFEPTIIQIR